MLAVRLSLLLLFPAALLYAETPAEHSTEILEGHSYHGEFANEGPRQSAYLMGGTGEVDFAVTTEHAEVPAFINQGIGQFYGFWYLEAERSFRHAAALDPDCAMAYWGAALAAQKSPDRAKGFIAEAVKRKDQATKREQLYIEALDEYLQADPEKKEERDAAYRDALEEIAIEYPDDLDAKALLCLQLYENREDGNYLAANALMEQVIAESPRHSVHHFRIHLWDRKKPERALDSAALCGQGSPAIAHMWHMPGHIYSRLKRYEDACWQQEASARVDHAHMIRDRVLPDQIHNYAHNNEWLIRNLLHVGRVRDAVDLARNMLELPRHPKYNTLEKRSSEQYGRKRLLQTLELYELWREAITLCESSYLEPTDELEEQVKRSRLLGISQAEIGRTDQAEQVRSQLQKQLDTQNAERKTAIADAKKEKLKELFQKEQKQKGEESNDEAADEDENPNTALANLTAQEQEELETRHQKELAAAEKKAAEPFDRNIKAMKAAIAGIQGHLALTKQEYAEAYKQLKADSGTDACLLARVQLKAEEREAAIKSLRKHVSKHPQEVQPQAGLVELLWLAEDREAARKEFETLRKMSGAIDLASPVFIRLNPIAEELGYPSDWRLAGEKADDLGERPSLDSLGPLHWSPPQAHNWTLTDAEGEQRSLKEFAGKPVVVIFYLGFECLHCAEQLQAFAPEYRKFQDAGIEMIAISTDDRDGLNTSIENYGDEPMPIPLVSNAELDVFKQWRVYDDFENQPLHGTFLIDPQGRILWQDISYEPFMQPDFVLGEAQRLLGQQRLSTEPPAASKTTTSLSGGAE